MIAPLTWQTADDEVVLATLKDLGSANTLAVLTRMAQDPSVAHLHLHRDRAARCAVGRSLGRLVRRGLVRRVAGAWRAR